MLSRRDHDSTARPRTPATRGPSRAPGSGLLGAWRRLAPPVLLVGACCLFAETPGAQSRKLFAKYSRPLRTLTLDPATGTVVRGALPRDRAASTVADFRNTDLSGFTGIDTGSGFCEWIDAGVKGHTGNASDLMNSIVFGYCSAKLDPSSGGPGGSLRLGFYEGYTVGGASPTTAVAVWTLTGLPANTASSSYLGGFRCFFLRMVVDPLISFADGPIGYSWRFLDSGTSTVNPMGGVLAGTWPYLSCVASCSGSIGQVDGQGMTDMIDAYCPPGTLRSTFTMGTTSGSFTSVAMDVEEVEDLPPVVFDVPTPPPPCLPIPDYLTADDAIVGQPWTASLTLGLNRTQASGWFLFFDTYLLNPPNGLIMSQFLGGFNFGLDPSGRKLLVPFNTSTLNRITMHSGVSGTTSTTASVNIPSHASLVGRPWYAQAMVFGPCLPADGGGNARMSTAVGGMVGI